MEENKQRSSPFNPKSDPFATRQNKAPVPKLGQTQSAVPKSDPSREQLKKKILDALEADNNLDPSQVKVESTKLAESLELEIYEYAGKNSKDRSYREKGNLIVNKLKGNLNLAARKVLRFGLVSEAEFVKGGSNVDDLIAKNKESGRAEGAGAKGPGKQISGAVLPPKINVNVQAKISNPIEFAAPQTQETNESANDFYNSQAANNTQEVDATSGINPSSGFEEKNEPTLNTENNFQTEATVNNSTNNKLVFASEFDGNQNSFKENSEIENSAVIDHVEASSVEKKNEPYKHVHATDSSKNLKKVVNISNTGASEGMKIADSSNPFDDAPPKVVFNEPEQPQEVKKTASNEAIQTNNLQRSVPPALTLNKSNQPPQVKTNIPPKLPSQPKKTIVPDQSYNSPKRDAAAKVDEQEKHRSQDPSSSINVPQLQQTPAKLNQPYPLASPIRPYGNQNSQAEPEGEKLEILKKINIIQKSKGYNQGLVDRDNASVISYISNNDPSRFRPPMSERDAPLPSHVAFNLNPNVKEHGKSLAEDVEYNPNVNIENSDYIKSLKEEVKTLREEKLSNSSNLDLLRTKCELQEKELDEMRQTIQELRTQLSKSNEVNYRLQINNLSNQLKHKEEEIRLLRSRNDGLNNQVQSFENRLLSFTEQYEVFRQETCNRYNSVVEEIRVIRKKGTQIQTENNLTESNEYDFSAGKINTQGSTYIAKNENKVNTTQIKTNPPKSNATFESGYDFNPKANATHVNKTSPKKEQNNTVSYNFSAGNQHQVKTTTQEAFEEDNLQDHQYVDNNDAHPVTRTSNDEVRSNNDFWGNQVGVNRVGLTGEDNDDDRYEKKERRELNPESGSTENRMEHINSNQQYFGDEEDNNFSIATGNTQINSTQQANHTHSAFNNEKVDNSSPDDFFNSQNTQNSTKQKTVIAGSKVPKQQLVPPRQVPVKSLNQQQRNAFETETTNEEVSDPFGALVEGSSKHENKHANQAANKSNPFLQHDPSQEKQKTKMPPPVIKKTQTQKLSAQANFNNETKDVFGGGEGSDDKEDIFQTMISSANAGNKSNSNISNIPPPQQTSSSHSNVFANSHKITQQQAPKKAGNPTQITQQRQMFKNDSIDLTNTENVFDTLSNLKGKGQNKNTLFD